MRSGKAATAIGSAGSCADHHHRHGCAARDGLCVAAVQQQLQAASSLGPDWDEAIDLICQEIIPALERRSSAYRDG